MENFYCDRLALIRFEAEYDVSGSVTVTATFDNGIRIKQTCGNPTCCVYRVEDDFMPGTYVEERSSIAVHVDLRALALIASSLSAPASAEM